MAVAQRAMTTREWGLLALLALLWGGSFFYRRCRKELPLTPAALGAGLAASLWRASLTGAASEERQGSGRFALLDRQQRPARLDRWGQTHLAAGPPISTRRRRLRCASSRMSLRSRRLSRFKIIGPLQAWRRRLGYRAGPALGRER